MSTPLNPDIRVTETVMPMAVCNCCGDHRDDRSVKDVQFNWREPGRLHGRELKGGGSRIALCVECRRTAIIELAKSL